jgi:hypothetical protein
MIHTQSYRSRFRVAKLLRLLVIFIIVGVNGKDVSFRYIQDGLGFSVLRQETKRCAMMNSAPIFSSYCQWPTGFTKNSGRTFNGAVFDGQSVWLVPRGEATDVIRVDSRNGFMTRYSGWPSDLLFRTHAFVGGTFDGTSVWLAPCTATQVVRINISTGAMTGYNQWPPGFNLGTFGFVGAVFDGFFIWMALTTPIK